jgi:hypothetical protein
MKKTVRFDDQTMDRVSVLERDLDSSRKQIQILRKSKKELIENYERLLNDGDDEDSERSADREGGGDDSDLDNNGRMFDLKASSRPPLQVINRKNNGRQTTTYRKSKMIKGISRPYSRNVTNQMHK